ncbi:hypothetical protein E2C01_089775 [Portunus trituberculatus]|uniref:Uncharacterized protein n=1 Tax=Portunus trituberculatus TaxID=210409 RepID=A0A5B7JNC3_PORTR|nr:hypothetical protein [Portunus trituberculatus]
MPRVNHISKCPPPRPLSDPAHLSRPSSLCRARAWAWVCWVTLTHVPRCCVADDTYMYDDDVGEAGAGAGVGVLGPPHHWYDEPPYESDPEDFLIGKDAYREPYGGGLRVVVTEEDIISLRTAGDISVPRDVAKVAHTQWSAGGVAAYPSRAVPSHRAEPSYQASDAFPVPVYDNVRLVSVGGGRPVGRGSRRSEPDYHNMEGTARGGLRRPRRPLLREGGHHEDLAAADVHSVTSRLSGVSVETNRSDPTELRLSKYLVSDPSPSSSPLPGVRPTPAPAPYHPITPTLHPQPPSASSAGGAQVALLGCHSTHPLTS